MAGVKCYMEHVVVEMIVRFMMRELCWRLVDFAGYISARALSEMIGNVEDELTCIMEVMLRNSGSLECVGERPLFLS